MKEKLERVYNSFKTGVMIWIFAYILLYIASIYVGDFSVYNENIMKLLDMKNFVAQLLIAGTTYITLEIVLLHFLDNMLKIQEQEKNKIQILVKNVLVATLVIAVLCVVLYVLKERNVISKYILKFMMTIIAFKAIVFCIAQVVNTNIYNKKLKEKNRE